MAARGETGRSRRRAACRPSIAAGQRVDRILAAATELIGLNGSADLRMSEVAERAAIPIGSLYQYFPDKSAVIRSIAERYGAASRRCIEVALGGVHTKEDLREAYGGLLDQYYALMLAEPAMRDIWSGMQADKDLMMLELAESRACGALLAAAIMRADPGFDRHAATLTGFLIWQLGEAAIRLAITTGREEGDAIVAAFRHMTLKQILGE